ncbi:MAG: hypothetical protein HQ567_19970 [Candidatus Nealsonbacteria bacterium]|nr:hypothetical protein [Candidatus Nealsonbacteria bacterium]
MSITATGNTSREASDILLEFAERHDWNRWEVIQVLCDYWDEQMESLEDMATAYLDETGQAKDFEDWLSETYDTDGQ